MADPTPASFNNSWKAVITLAALLFNGGIIVFCLWKGVPSNSLHTSALAWSYLLGAGILVGLGVGTITPALTEVFKRSP